jgi:5-oxoprolinase (ATP-hydrolysing) subunit A
VSSANVACGFHAGDPSIMRRVCTIAAERGVAVGAHVSYRDIAGFGRRFIAVPRDELSADIAYQIGALAGIAASVGTRVRYVKAHGALYNRAHTDPSHAGALVDAVAAYGLPVLCQPGSETARIACAAGVSVVSEAFADRGYQASGALVPRTEPGAVLDDPAEVAERAVRMARDGEVRTPAGERVVLQPQSLCVHGDSPNAVAMARAVRAALESAGIPVRPFA